MYNDKTLKSVAEAVKKVMEAELSAKQKAIAKIEHPKHKIDAGDLAALRSGKKPVKESDDLGPVKDTRGAVLMVHKVSGREKNVVNDPKVIKKHEEMGYKVFKSVKEETQVQEASHQAKTTMKHVKNPTAGEKAAAKDIKPGIKGYRDRIAMLHSAGAEGRLKKEEASQEEFTAEIKKAQAKSQGKEKADVAKPAVVAVKQESVEQVDEAIVKGKGYDNPENERKAPEGKLSMTSLMPGHSDKAARLAAVQAKGKLVKGSAQSAKQVEKGMKKEEVEQIDERTLSEPETAEKERLVKSMKKNLAGFKERYGERAKSVMYATATDRAKENK